MDRKPGSTDAAPNLEELLSALGDGDCRTILRELDRPKTAKEIMTACDLSQTTTYRKLDELSETALVEERTELRDDGHHATSYVRSIEGVYVDLVGEDPFDVRLVDADEAAETPGDESPDERLARLWSEVGDEL